MTRSLRRHYLSCGKCHGNERLKRKAFRRLRKTDIEGADVTCWGRLYQVRAAATGKARSPTVDSRVRRTFSVSEEEERRRLRVPKSAVYSSSSARRTLGFCYSRILQAIYPSCRQINSANTN